MTKQAEAKFAGADLDGLRQYCTRLGINFTKSHNATTLRKLLNAAMAEDSKQYTEVVSDEDGGLSDEERRLEAMNLVGLNLRSQAGWQGRRRTIILHRSMDHESTRPQFFAWGRLHCYVPMGVECSIPYPIFEILKLTAGSRLVRVRKQDEEGRIYFKDKWVPSQRFMFSDLDDDPATLNLPRDMLEMITQLHGLTNGFAGYSERQFKEICSRLTIPIKAEWTEVDMRMAVEAKCGLSTQRVDLGAPDIAQAATG